MAIDSGTTCTAGKICSDPRDLSPATVECIDERGAPYPFVGRTRRWLALFDLATPTTLEALSRPSTTVAGTTIDTSNFGPHASAGPRFDGLSLINLATMQATRVPLDHSWQLWPIGFSHDDRYLAFVTMEPSRLTLRWVDCCSPETVYSVDARLNGTGILRDAPLGSWVGDTTRVLVLLVDERHEAHMATSPPLDVPTIFDTTDPVCEPNTSRLLADDQPSAFCRYVRSQLAIVDVASAIVTPIDAPALWDSASASPDARHVLLREFTNSDEPATKWREFTRRLLVKELETGATVRELWSPSTAGSEPHYRACRWHPLRPSTVGWIQATSTGDRCQTLCAPFSTEPLTLLDVAAHAVKIDWTTTGRLILTTVRPRGEQRFLTDDGRTLCGESRATSDQPTGEAETSMELLSLWTAADPDERVILETDGELFVTGHQHQANNVLHPFFDAVLAADGRRRRVSGDRVADSYERVLASLTDDGSLVVTSVESPREPPGLSIRELKTGTRSWLESTARPSALARAVRRHLHYTGPGGVEHEISIFLPPAANHEPLPFVVWINPSMGPAGTASNRYPTLTWRSPLHLALEGYGVVESAPLTVVGSRETAVSDLVGEAEALVDALVSARLAQRGRLAVGGYCVGGWIASLLLAHSDRFAAGISCGGFFNLTAIAANADLTGRAAAWSDPTKYADRSPLMQVRRFNSPLLLMHGAREEFPVHQRTQSLQMFAALHSAGKTARYVRLPHEKHGYRARATVLRIFSEILRWCDEHV